jgi:hypothetical protein
MSISRVIRTIEKFPVPIVSGSMALKCVQNIGTKFAEYIDEWLREKTGSELKRMYVDESPEETKSKLPRTVVSMEVGGGLWVAFMCLFYKSKPTVTISELVDTFFA